MNSLVQTYQWISVIGYVCAGIFFAATVFLFFYLNIPQVLGYLTKRTERKAIEAIRAETEQKLEKSSQEIAKTHNAAQTDEISAEKLEWDAKNSMAGGAAGTTVLVETAATTVLNETDTTTVIGEAGATTVLEQSGYEMAVEPNDFQKSGNLMPAYVVVEEEIVWIHTAERIS